ncbi:MAG: hypothetical protein R6V86_11720, partial [Spirochaetia bacterium]
MFHSINILFIIIFVSFYSPHCTIESHPLSLLPGTVETVPPPAPIDCTSMLKVIEIQSEKRCLSASGSSDKGQCNGIKLRTEILRPRPYSPLWLPASGQIPGERGIGGYLSR